MQAILSEELDGAKQQDYFTSIGLNCEIIKAVENVLDIQCHIVLTFARPNHLGIFGHVAMHEVCSVLAYQRFEQKIGSKT